MRTTPSFRRIASYATLAAVVSVAAASDGQAGGGTPIVFCNQAVTTSAFLVGDLTCGSTDGIVVGADGITIDLKRFTLRGNRTVGHYGIDDNGHDQVTVKNGVVRNFYSGVYAQGGADRVSVSSLLATGNASVGIWIVGDSAKIQSTTVSGNASQGIAVQGDSAQVKSSAATGNSYEGIFVSGDSPSVKSSVASGNGSSGIRVEGNAATIAGNRAEGNGFFGGGSDFTERGILAVQYTIPPAGKNVARGNDNPADCSPALLCP